MRGFCNGLSTVKSVKKIPVSDFCSDSYRNGDFGVTFLTLNSV